MDKSAVLKEFKKLPGVGNRVAEDLYNLGYRDVSEFKTAEPIMMYERLCIRAGKHIDRCMLYTFKCIVYFVSHKNHDPKKLKWWYWKDQK